MSGSKQDTSSTWVDSDDAPELTDEWFAEADLYEGEKRIRRGRPRAAAPKELLTLRYSPDVLSAFRATGKGWQTRINAALTDWLKTHSPGEIA